LENLTQIIQQLEAEAQQLSRAAQTLREIQSSNGIRRKIHRKPKLILGGAPIVVKKRRTMSAVAKKKIADAQRARWAMIRTA
jgi:hypothetical protein